jgi:hypothetical protein
MAYDVVHTSPSYIHKLPNVWHMTSLWHTTSSTRRRLTYINSLMSDIWRHYDIWAVVHTSPSYTLMSDIWRHYGILSDVIFVTITYMTSSWHNFATVCRYLPADFGPAMLLVCGVTQPGFKAHLIASAQAEPNLVPIPASLSTGSGFCRLSTWPT